MYRLPAVSAATPAGLHRSIAEDGLPPLSKSQTFDVKSPPWPKTVSAMEVLSGVLNSSTRLLELSAT